MALVTVTVGPAWNASPARASTEEFSTFSCEAQEEDDESLIDHIQARMPESWAQEWARGGQRFRSSQGCLTSGQWFMQTELNLAAPIGKTSLFGFDLRQRLSDDWSVDYYDLTFRRTIGKTGFIGWLLRPFHDKSLQDMGPFWSFGSDSTGLRVRGAFVLEDVFNNLWAFRQRRVGELSEPYLKHPFEPSLELGWAGRSTRLALGGTWLTPSVKQLEVVPGEPEALYGLWGGVGSFSADLGRAPWRWHLDAWNEQVRETHGAADGTLETVNYRRQWRTETRLAADLGRRTTITGTFLYGERFQDYTPAPQPTLFASIDRMVEIRGDMVLSSRVSANVGLMREHLVIDQEGSLVGRITSPGTRYEDRALLGVEARFGNLWVAATEGLELDHEPYQVWFIHDKAFFQLMARF